MIRRYSGPRTLSPGCTKPRRACVRLAAGLTTMPSPPPPVSSVHQAVAASSDAGSVTSTNRCPVVRTSSGSAATSRSATARCQACGRSANVAPAAASTWNGANDTPASPSVGQQ
jgi:hypothetical protein